MTPIARNWARMLLTFVAMIAGLAGGGLQHVGYLNHDTTGAMGGLGTDIAVFKHQTPGRRNAKTAGGKQIGLRVGLGTGHIIPGDDIGKKTSDPSHFQLAMRALTPG